MPPVYYKDVGSILMISLSCIGDVILTTPVMKVLKDNYPAAKLTVVAGPTAVPILSRHEWVDSLIVFENKGRHRGLAGAARLVRELRAAKYDIVVDLRNSMIPYFLRCRYRITAHGAHLKNKNDLERHAVDRHLDVLEAAGLPVTYRKIKVTIPSDVDEKVAGFMERRGLAGIERLVAVYPGAGSPYKLYPVEKFAAALETLEKEAQCYFVIIGSEEDRLVCETLAGMLDGRAESVAGDLDILEVGALFTHCTLLISNDSGPMHLGAAVGTPTVALFGPTNAKRYGPRGDSNRIVWRREPCNPCKFPECGRDSCIGDIPPADVAAAALELLGISNG